MIEKRGFNFSPKGKNRPLHIYLPEGYGASDERYPVMYFFDGQNLFRDQDATYGKSWGLETFLDRWGKKMILVGLECGHEGNERLDEYSPYSFDFFTGRVHGTGKQTMDWIVNEVKPVIDRQYRTYSFREATGIGGSSMGGLMSLYAAVAYNGVFSKAACLSSAIYPCFAEVIRQILDTKLNADTKVYLSWGTEETGGTRENPDDDWQSQASRNHLAVEAMLRQQNVDVKLFCQRHGRHCEADWEKQVPGFMNYLWMNQR